MDAALETEGERPQGTVVDDRAGRNCCSSSCVCLSLHGVFPDLLAVLTRVCACGWRASACPAVCACSLLLLALFAVASYLLSAVVVMGGACAKDSPVADRAKDGHTQGQHANNADAKHTHTPLGVIPAATGGGSRPASRADTHGRRLSNAGSIRPPSRGSSGPHSAGTASRRSGGGGDPTRAVSPSPKHGPSASTVPVGASAKAVASHAAFSPVRADSSPNVVALSPDRAKRTGTTGAHNRAAAAKAIASGADTEDDAVPAAVDPTLASFKKPSNKKKVVTSPAAATGTAGTTAANTSPSPNTTPRPQAQGKPGSHGGLEETITTTTVTVTATTIKRTPQNQKQKQQPPSSQQQPPQQTQGADANALEDLAEPSVSSKLAPRSGLSALLNAQDDPSGSGDSSERSGGNISARGPSSSQAAAASAGVIILPNSARRGSMKKGGTITVTAKGSPAASAATANVSPAAAPIPAATAAAASPVKSIVVTSASAAGSKDSAAAKQRITIQSKAAGATAGSPSASPSASPPASSVGGGPAAAAGSSLLAAPKPHNRGPSITIVPKPALPSITPLAAHSSFNADGSKKSAAQEKAELQALLKDMQVRTTSYISVLESKTAAESVQRDKQQIAAAQSLIAANNAEKQQELDRRMSALAQEKFLAFQAQSSADKAASNTKIEEERKARMAQWESERKERRKTHEAEEAMREEAERRKTEAAAAAAAERAAARKSEAAATTASLLSLSSTIVPATPVKLQLTLESSASQSSQIDILSPHSKKTGGSASGGGGGGRQAVSTPSSSHGSVVSTGGIALSPMTRGGSQFASPASAAHSVSASPRHQDQGDDLFDTSMDHDSSSMLSPANTPARAKGTVAAIAEESSRGELSGR